VPAYEPALALESSICGATVFIIGFARYLFLNTRSKDVQGIGDSGLGRYATLHVPEHVTHVMKSAPTLSANGSQAVR
jgi:hypothetical protein